MCSSALPEDHQHLIEPVKRRLLCVCDACAILFERQDTKYRRVPRHIHFLSQFKITDAQWEALLIPIDMAFFFHSTAAGRIVALYPSPAGATESLLALDSWSDLVTTNPVLRGMTPDVEALLVNRVARPGEKHSECYIVPIDECYKLVGLIRSCWKGFSGGTEVWEEIGRFFDGLRQRATIALEATEATNA